jgi:hypothetical protein
MRVFKFPPSTHQRVKEEICHYSSQYSAYNRQLRRHLPKIYLPDTYIIISFQKATIGLKLNSYRDAQILEKKWEFNEMVVHQLVIDFKKACDVVRREVLYNILIEFCSI